MNKEMIKIKAPEEGYNTCNICKQKELPVFDLELGKYIITMCDACFTDVNMQIFEHLLR